MSSEPTRGTAIGAQRITVAIALLGAATLAGAWLFQWAGYAPCELCLKERIPYYAGVPLALLVAFFVRHRPALAPAGFIALALIFGAGTLLAGYHAGVEWKLWPGPASCTGTYTAPTDVGDFFNQLKTTAVIRCDAAALRIVGVSLAGWDALVSLLLTALALIGARLTLRQP